MDYLIFLQDLSLALRPEVVTKEAECIIKKIVHRASVKPKAKETADVFPIIEAITIKQIFVTS